MQQVGCGSCMSCLDSTDERCKRSELGAISGLLMKRPCPFVSPKSANAAPDACHSRPSACTTPLRTVCSQFFVALPSTACTAVLQLQFKSATWLYLYPISLTMRVDIQLGGDALRFRWSVAPSAVQTGEAVQSRSGSRLWI